MRIAQLVPALHGGDAIGNNVIALRNHFRQQQAESDVFYIDVDSDLSDQGRHFTQYTDWIQQDPNSITILHYALPSPLNDLLRNAPGKRVLVYHNITPPEFLAGYPHLQHISRMGRDELEKLKDVPTISLADSEYNRLELNQLGFSNTLEMPIFLDFAKYDQGACPVTLRMFEQKDIINFIFVGRVTPNKCQHDLIRFYGYYKRYVNPRCRLFLVGKYSGFEDYLWKCTRLANEWALGDVHFTGRVSHAELLAYYQMADLFVSMSEHEGFGVPILESMYLDIPIMAYKAAAVPYTMGKSGIRFARKRQWLELAELADLSVRDKSLRDQILAGQRKRLDYFSQKQISGRWDKIIQEQLK